MFIEIPASAISIKRRSKINAVGINDADYKTQPRSNGRAFTCPYYRKWSSMLRRCYSKKTQEKQPAYKGCSVCDEWLVFSVFRSWMIKQNWKGKELDKDIITPGNKIYSPDNCCFVEQYLNKLLETSAASRGPHPLGVSFDKSRNKYLSKISINNRTKNLGGYNSPKTASDVYIKAKTALILQAASEQTDERIANGLRLHAELLNNH